MNIYPRSLAPSLLTASRARSLVSHIMLAAAMLVAVACTVPKRGPSTAVKGSLFADVVDHHGAKVSHEALVGHWSVLWFYPKAQTSG